MMLHPRRLAAIAILAVAADAILTAAFTAVYSTVIR